ncbi:hypothetical protein VQD75_004053 [Vibrio alginolyticus]|nr:hypothetical protein [Vibrio alginolyticus]
MAKTIEEKRKKAREAQKAARDRAIARQLAKQKDPEFKEKQRKKALATAKRQQDRAIAKAKSPEYQAQIAKKREEARERARTKATSRSIKPVQSKKPAKASRGLKGRTPTAEEKRIMDAICKLPCIACYLQGRENPVISYHHIDGRTKELAHARGLPLCAHHHDTPADRAVIEQYPDLIPVHARGTVGGKRAWEAIHGTQQSLVLRCYEMAGISVPVGLFD